MIKMLSHTMWYRGGVSETCDVHEYIHIFYIPLAFTDAIPEFVCPVYVWGIVSYVVVMLCYAHF